MIRLVLKEALSMEPCVRMESFRDDMKFSVAHFTIFSAAERERIHGHNYYVKSIVRAEVSSADISYDYRIERSRVRKLCKWLNEYFLLPGQSEFLQIVEVDNEAYKITFANRSMIIPREDVRILPLANITAEGLAKWFITKLTEDSEHIRINAIKEIGIVISTTRGQGSELYWRS